jgi:uncharacterized coiled-coil protein SlyX
MAEKKSEKKVVSRKVTLALGVICIVLAAGLVGTIVVYAPKASDLQSQIATKDSTIASLNSTVSSLTSQISSLNSQISTLNSQVVSLQSTLNETNNALASYVAILGLSQSSALVQNFPVTQEANSTTLLWNDYITYAGYVVVQLTSSSNTTYAGVVYALPVTGENFDFNVTLGTSGTAVFPVLPGLIAVGIGNMELVDSVNATVTAVYYY